MGHLYIFHVILLVYAGDSKFPKTKKKQLRIVLKHTMN